MRGVLKIGEEGQPFSYKKGGVYGGICCSLTFHIRYDISPCFTWFILIDVPGFFFRGGVKIDPLECRNFFSGGKVGGPGGK